jgi:outer membrane murein-binding lipoprotein Lpp
MSCVGGSIKFNGTAKFITFVITVITCTVAVVMSIEGMRSDIRVNTTEIKNLGSDVNALAAKIEKVDDKVNDHIKEHRN